MIVLPHSPVVLTIAGFDPSGCAGILADIKTFEANGVYGMAVCTANTAQNVSSFKSANWIAKEEITGQLDLLQQEVHFEFVKIGLIESFELLNTLIDKLLYKKPGVKIIWDPVCKASAGFVFHTEVGKGLLEKVCAKLFLVTPNLDEQKILTPGSTVEQAGKYLSQFCHVLIKGGHDTTGQATDILFTKGKAHYMHSNRLHNVSKRGTGCVLSAAIIAGLAKGESVTQACENAKRYVHGYLASNESMIGVHSYENR